MTLTLSQQRDVIVSSWICNKKLRKVHPFCWWFRNPVITSWGWQLKSHYLQAGFKKVRPGRWWSPDFWTINEFHCEPIFLIQETWSTSQLGESWAPDVTLARFLGGSSSTGGLSSWVKPFITWFEDLMNLPLTVQKKISSLHLSAIYSQDISSRMVQGLKYFSHPPPSDSWKSTWCLRSPPSRQRSDWIQSTAHPKKPQCQVEATKWQALEPKKRKAPPKLRKDICCYIMIYIYIMYVNILVLEKNASQVNHTTPLCGSCPQLSTPHGCEGWNLRKVDGFSKRNVAIQHSAWSQQHFKKE